MNTPPPATWETLVSLDPAMSAVRQQVLLLLAEVPLATAALLQRLGGWSGADGIYDPLNSLADLGLVGRIKIPTQSGPAEARWFLTSAGIAWLARRHGVDAAALAARRRLTDRALLGALRHLPALARDHNLLDALVAARPGGALLGWARPWRGAYLNRRRQSRPPAGLTLPAAVAVRYDDGAAFYALLPDNPWVPPRDLQRLLLRWTRWLDWALYFRDITNTPEDPLWAAAGGGAPRLLIVLQDAARRAPWAAAIADMYAGLGRPPIRRTELIHLPLLLPPPPGRGGGARLDQSWPVLAPPVAVTATVAPPVAADAADLPGHWGRLPAATPAAGPLPALGGEALAAAAPRRHTVAVGRLATLLTPREWDLLVTIGEHPYLPPRALAAWLGWRERATGARLATLVALDLVRLIAPAEVAPKYRALCAQGLPELTGRGLSAFAGRCDLAPKAAVGTIGLAGSRPPGSGAADGRRQPFGARGALLRDLAHTLLIGEVAAALAVGARAARGAGRVEGVERWASPAIAQPRALIQPDAEVFYRSGPDRYRLWLEIDRATEGPRDLAEKLARYVATVRDGRWAAPPPLILLVVGTREVGAPWDAEPRLTAAREELIARVARDTALPGAPRLPLLLTTLDRLRADPLGPVGAIWRTADAGPQRRRRPWVAYGAAGAGGADR
jgi:hypothetical protein